VILMIWPVMAAAFVALFTSTALGWRLFLLVPMAGVMILYLYPQNAADIAHSLIADPGKLVWLPVAYLVGLAFAGPQATILGELAWLAVRVTKLPSRMSLRSALVLGAAVGSLFGVGYQIASAHVLSRFLPAFFPEPTWGAGWLAAYIGGGAVAGLLVAYYAVKEFRHGPHDAKDEVAETLTSGAAGAGL
jgi:hypothetical protein